MPELKAELAGDGLPTREQFQVLETGAPGLQTCVRATQRSSREPGILEHSGDRPYGTRTSVSIHELINDQSLSLINQICSLSFLSFFFVTVPEHVFH